MLRYACTMHIRPIEKYELQTGRKDAAISRLHEGAGFSGHEKQAFVARPSG